MLHQNYIAVYRPVGVFNIKQFIFPIDLYYIMNKAKNRPSNLRQSTGN